MQQDTPIDVILKHTPIDVILKDTPIDVILTRKKIIFFFFLKNFHKQEMELYGPVETENLY